MTPSVSVIIPVFNVERHIDACLSSVLSQSFPHFEVLCVNDGSTDGSYAKLQEWGAKDKRIRILSQENRGVSVSRNNALREAKGEYILFVDSDDTIHPQLIELVYQIAHKEKADVVNFLYQRGDENSWDVKPVDAAHLQYRVTNDPLKYCYRKDDWEIAVTVWSKFYRREVLHNLWFLPKIGRASCRERVYGLV